MVAAAGGLVTARGSQGAGGTQSAASLLPFLTNEDGAHGMFICSEFSLSSPLEMLPQTRPEVCLLGGCWYP